MTPIREILAASPVMPVVVVDDAQDAVALATALVTGGIRVIEVTLRTPNALACISAIRRAVPAALVGAGTILGDEDLAHAVDAGAQFGVSPGSTPALLSSVQASTLPFLPGVMTPSDVIAARAAGFDAAKLFPARSAGGIEMLRALHGPFAQMVFCPTGGVDESTASHYLSLVNVACVGGSWLAPGPLVKARDWEAITGLAQTASQLQRSWPGACGTS